MDINEVRELYRKIITVEDDRILDIVLGTVIGNQLDGDALSLYLIGPPSSGKTEILRSFISYPKAEYLSSMTVNALFSGMKSEGGKKEKAIILRLRDEEKNILIFKDFGSLLQDNFQVRNILTSQLREVADGQYDRGYGTGSGIHWRGKLAIMAGVTPAIDTYSMVDQTLGERFLRCRMSHKDLSLLAEKALYTSGYEDKIREEVAEGVKSFLMNLKFDPGAIYDIESCAKKIIALSCFVAIGRTSVPRDKYHKTVVTTPEPEAPPRLIKQLLGLASGISILHNKSAIDDEIYYVLKKVALDSIQPSRINLLACIWNSFGQKPFTINDLRKDLHLPKSSLRLYLEDLYILKILRIPKDTDLDRPDITWSMTSNFTQYIEQSEVFK